MVYPDQNIFEIDKFLSLLKTNCILQEGKTIIINQFISKRVLSKIIFQNVSDNNFYHRV